MFPPASHNLRLPPEIWWMVIDIAGAPADHGAFNSRSHYPTLRTCALVCQHWLRRSRWMLYRRVYLSSESIVSLFLRTISEESSSFLADLVQEVEVDGICQPWSRRSSFAFLFQHRLARLSNLNLYNLNISRGDPADFLSRIALCPIRHLTLWNCYLPLSRTIPIIWSLDDLQSLVLHLDVHPYRDLDVVDPSSRFAAECRLLQTMQMESGSPSRCRQLRQLTLGGVYVQSTMFPPPGVFGDAIIQLNLILQMPRRLGNLPAPLALRSEFVPTLSNLQLFHVNATLTSDCAYAHPALRSAPISPAYRAMYQRFVSSTLSSLVSARSPIHTLSLTFTMLGYYDPFTPLLRSDIARFLFYDGIRAQLRSLPHGARMYVSLEDTEPLGSRTAGDWHRLIGDRVPEWRDRLHVRVRGVAAMPQTLDQITERAPSEADTVHAANRNLWVAYGQSRTTPQRPPLDRSGLCVGGDPSARPTLLNSGAYDVRPEYVVPATPQAGMSEADAIHEANRQLWLRKFANAR